MGEGVALVAAKAVMHQRALILGEESKVFEGLTTTLAMNAQPGQALPDEHVQPGRALGSQTAFIRPEDRALEEGFPDALIGLLQPGGRFADPVDHTRSRKDAARTGSPEFRRCVPREPCGGGAARRGTIRTAVADRIM